MDRARSRFRSRNAASATALSAGVKGRKVTRSPDIRIDLRNAGADVVEDHAVVVDKGASTATGASPSCQAVIPTIWPPSTEPSRSTPNP